MESTPIRLILIDDHVVVRQALASLLGAVPEFTILASLGKNRQTADIIRSLNPDMLLVNQTEIDYESILTTIAIHIDFPALPMLILTSMSKDQGIPKSLARLTLIGLDRLLPRETTLDELTEAIREGVWGSAGGSPLRDHRTWRQSPSLPLECYLTPREQEILQHMARPGTYRDIAQQLSLSEETVRSHAKNIMAKLQQSSRFLAVLEAVRYGFIDLQATVQHDRHGPDGHNGKHEGEPLLPRCALNEQGLPLCAETGQLTGPCPVRQFFARQHHR